MMPMLAGERMLDQLRSSPLIVSGIEIDAFGCRRLVALPVLPRILVSAERVRVGTNPCGTDHLPDECIHEDKRPYPCDELLGDTRYGHATIGMAAEHDVRKVLATDETQHLVNVSIERDGRANEMGPLAKTVSVGVWTLWPARRSNLLTRW